MRREPEKPEAKCPRGRGNTMGVVKRGRGKGGEAELKSYDTWRRRGGGGARLVRRLAPLSTVRKRGAAGSL